jgi:DNA-binding transcriptional MerR regulator
MWIAEFSEAAGLPVATTRFYVRRGLLHPRMGTAGGSRPYLEFSPRDLRLARAIQAGQALGMSLAEIKSLIDERRAGGAGKQKMLAAMAAHRQKLTQRARELRVLIKFVDAKMAWLQGDGSSPMPDPP